MSAIEQRASELLARMEKAKRNERGHWCDARAAVDSACEVLPQLIAALTPSEGFVLVPVEPPEAMGDAPRYIAGDWSRRSWEAALEDMRWLAARPEAK